MKDIKLDLRVRSILQQICLKGNYITISDIANELGVSSRTVLRELPVVEKWLQGKGFTLDKKTGVGIRINGSEEERQILIDIINGEQGEVNYSPEVRQIMIISELLKSQQPAKLYNFTGILKVTEGTISNDLDKAEEWLIKHHLKLIRKPGLGVYIEAKEEDIRKAIIDLVYENIGEERLLALIRNKLPQSSFEDGNREAFIKSRLLNLMNEDTIRNLVELVHDLEKNIGYRLADNAYIGLIVHVAIVIQRIRKNEPLKMNEEFLEELRKSKEYSIAEDLAKEIGNLFQINISDDETGYIAMHIKGSKNYDGSLKTGNRVIGNFELVKLSKKIIKIAEKETGKFLEHNDKLLVGLVNHLGTALSRIKMNMEIRNPLLEEIKSHYSYLYKLGEKCSEPIEKLMGAKMPESEIAYIAMHLGAAIEKGETLQKRVYRAAIACTSGIGTSSLLATRIQKEYDNIEVVDTISTLRQEEEWLREKGIEFIISTVKIANSPVPVVAVNPLLFEEDKEKITKQLKMLEGTAAIRPIRKKGKLQLKEKIQLINSYGEAAVEILNNFFLNVSGEDEGLEDIISGVSKNIVHDADKEEMLREAITSREEKGGTFITGHGILLLHCRTMAVEELYFGAVKPLEEISFINGKNETEKMELAVIMIAPENTSKNFIETISYVSRMLIERQEFTKLLKSGLKDEALEELSSILEEFYSLKCSKYWRDNDGR